MDAAWTTAAGHSAACSPSRSAGTPSRRRSPTPAFEQLVDGDLKDKDPSHKPKDGDITGPIQVAEATWILLRREGLIPGQKVDPADPQIKKQTYELIYEVKLKEEMGEVMVELMQSAEIDNKLTGKVKLANESVDVDKEVQLMGNKSAAANGTPPRRPRPPAPLGKTPTPAALSPDVAQQAENLVEAPRRSQVSPAGARNHPPAG